MADTKDLINELREMVAVVKGINMGHDTRQQVAALLQRAADELQKREG